MGDGHDARPGSHLHRRKRHPAGSQSILGLPVLQSPRRSTFPACPTCHQRATYTNVGYRQVYHFVADYPNALARATALDQNVLSAAAAVDSSGHYADLVSLAARQAMGGTELTIGVKSQNVPGSSQWNMSDVKMFMKNVGTDGYVRYLFFDILC